MKVRKCIRVLLTVLLFVLLSMGCAKAGHLDEKTSNGGEYLANVLSGEISEMKFIGGGETIAYGWARDRVRSGANGAI